MKETGYIGKLNFSIIQFIKFKLLKIHIIIKREKKYRLKKYIYIYIYTHQKITEKRRIILMKKKKRRKVLYLIIYKRKED